MSGSVTDRWASGTLYEPYVGRWSRLVASEFLAWLAAPSGLDWLDIGCGTGVLAGTIAAGCAPRRLAGIDPSAGFLVHAQRLGPGIALARAGAEAPCPSARRHSTAPCPASC
jgi:trans-aconitate methyltransferase